MYITLTLPIVTRVTEEHIKPPKLRFVRVAALLVRPQVAETPPSRDVRTVICTPRSEYRTVTSSKTSYY